MTIKFFVNFQTFFSDFRREITEKGLKRRKKVETAKKLGRPAFGCAQHSKAGGNTEHSFLEYSYLSLMYLSVV